MSESAADVKTVSDYLVMRQVCFGLTLPDNNVALCSNDAILYVSTQ